MAINYQKLLIASAIEGVVLLAILAIAVPMVVPMLGGLAALITAELTIGFAVTAIMAVAIKNVAYATVLKNFV